jgi:hypothetical protein
MVAWHHVGCLIFNRQEAANIDCVGVWGIITQFLLIDMSRATKQTFRFPSKKLRFQGTFRVPAIVVTVFQTSDWIWER